MSAPAPERRLDERAAARIMNGLIACAIALFLWSWPAGSLAAESDDAEAQVATAINALRGIHWDAIPPKGREKLGERLDLAWKTLFDHPGVAVPAIRNALKTETADSFLIIDLCDLLLNFEPKSAEEVAGYFMHADVNAHPTGTFHVTSRMGALHCARCLPAVGRILELKELDALIPQHALPVDLNLGIVFSLGQYGDDAIPPVLEGLSSDNCVVRGNAALALSWLQPVVVPGAIRELALKDPCSPTRASAWTALGVLDEPDLPRLALERLHATPSPDKVEKMGLVSGLGASFRREATAALESLKTDPDADVRAAALKEIQGLAELESLRSELKTRIAGASKASPSKVRSRLERAARKGRMDEDDEEPKDLLSILAQEDIPLLNRARAAVLNRLSDECLDEYFPLTYVVRGLRHFQADVTGNAPPSN